MAYGSNSNPKPMNFKVGDVVRNNAAKPKRLCWEWAVVKEIREKDERFRNVVIEFDNGEVRLWWHYHLTHERNVRNMRNNAPKYRKAYDAHLRSLGGGVQLEDRPMGAGSERTAVLPLQAERALGTRPEGAGHLDCGDWEWLVGDSHEGQQPEGCYRGYQGSDVVAVSCR